MDNRAVRISKFLSLLLRHQPEKIGLSLDQSGWASVDQLIEASRSRGVEFTLEELQNVVASNDKKRFSLSEDGLWIRANQGHSIEVELGYSPTAPPEILYHGTAERFLTSIKIQGLIKGKRHHVHLSADLDTATKVGRRHGRPVVLRIEAGRMYRDGSEPFSGRQFYLDPVGGEKLGDGSLRVRHLTSQEAHRLYGKS